MDRNLDGVYFRIKRGEKFKNVCFSDLTESEMESVLANRSEEWLRNLCITLGKTIKDIGEQIYIYGGYFNYLDAKTEPMGSKIQG